MASVSTALEVASGTAVVDPEPLDGDQQHRVRRSGGVFNFGQLTLNSSTVSHNTSPNGEGAGIFNCGASFHGLRSLYGAPGSLTLNSSIVSDNVGGSGDGGGILRTTDKRS